MIILLKDMFLKLMFNIVKIYKDFIMIYPFCLKQSKFKKLQTLYQTYKVKKNVIHIRNLKQALNYKFALKK